MKRSYWIEHRGKRIVYVDFSNADLAGLKQAIAEAKPLIAGEPPQSVLCLVETPGTRFTTEVGAVVREFTEHNKPFIKMTALVGIEGIQKVALNSVFVFTRRKNIVTKRSRTEALDFLAAQ